jgi:BirA family biotin operon repressor/biotin-[acetyl-CoA-carboxylase] ligase
MEQLSKDRRVIRLEETVSTNIYLRELVRERSLEEGSMVISDFQVNGRGQMGNSWFSSKGENLLFSLLIYPKDVPANEQFIISRIASLAVKNTLDRFTDDIRIKWPNDIYWKDAKICGILIENKLSHGQIKDCIIGVGLNVNQHGFNSDAPNPVSLVQILGHEVDRQTLLEEIVKRFDLYLHDLETGEYGNVAGSYANSLYRSHGFHKYKDAEEEFEAAIIEVEDDGHLILRDREGRIRSYAFKEIEFIIS